MTARLWIGGRRAFHVFGLAGLALSLVVCVAVLAAHDVALWALPVIAGTAVATFLALAMAVKVVTGARVADLLPPRDPRARRRRGRAALAGLAGRGAASTPPCSASAPSSSSGGSAA